MIYAKTRKESETRRKAFIRKWRLKHRAVADSLEEAGEKLFTFTRLPPDQWKSVRTTNAIERLHEEFKRRIKMQTVLPSAETAAMLSGRCSPLGPGGLSNSDMRSEGFGSIGGVGGFARSPYTEDAPSKGSMCC